MNIVFYCPDTNFIYNGNTPDIVGIGGGKTALIRLAKALANLGHQVSCYVNVDKPGIYHGVKYYHFKEAKSIECDIFLFTSTSGNSNLSVLNFIPIKTNLKIAWVHSVFRPPGLNKVNYDYILAPSYFMKEVITYNWGVSADKIIVCYNGIEESNFQEAERLNLKRDPFSIVYFGHPSKGLDAVIDIVRELRKKDKRFYLDIYGGYELWGQPSQPIPEEEGIIFKGLVNQKKLAKQLFKYGFCLALQDIPETFGISIVEAKRAGVIVIVSKVGAYSEIISNEYDGFLIDEYYKSMECFNKVIKLIMNLISDVKKAEFIRKNAKINVWTWNKQAEKLTTQLSEILQKKPKTFYTFFNKIYRKIVI